ncbi:MAG: hypothetical protein ACI8PB_004472 [Desulforhopalus sp.]|jgi:hypothetical protein
MSLPIWISEKLSDCVLNWAQSVLLFLPNSRSRFSTFFIFSAIVLCLSGCSKTPTHLHSELLYNAEPLLTESTIISPPAFYVKSGDKPYNKIGTPTVTEKNGVPLALVSSTAPTMYIEQTSFTTTKKTYTNFIYRIHFPEVPFDWCNLHITTGKNPGLLIIYTIDPTDKLVLITTVHTCGCYLAFFPTEDLAKEVYPPNWPEETQTVFGYTLPAVFPSQLHTANQPYYFTLESGSHRISDISHTTTASSSQTITPLMKIQPMESLYHLPYKDGNISFFESAGRREGYVKNNGKILERLLISWWAFDWHVGEDKAYGKSDSSTTPFYTSLKFWQRGNSDMKNFPGFLAYWGWAL